MGRQSVLLDTSLGQMTEEDKEACRPAILWMTGLSGSGKTTTARAIEKTLTVNHERKVIVVDGDELRQGLCSNLGFSSEDRMENIRRAAEVAKLFYKAGFVVVVSLISPLKDHREVARKICGDSTFFEIFVDCPLATCERKDVKGLYRKARRGEIKEFTGVSSPYEVPVNPDLTIQTGHLNIEASCKAVMIFLENREIIDHV